MENPTITLTCPTCGDSKEMPAICPTTGKIHGAGWSYSVKCEDCMIEMDIEPIYTEGGFCGKVIKLRNIKNIA
jgi:hypothetical protein